jgi:hypothetical protein
MDSVAAPVDAWKKLWQLCEDNDVTAIRTWIEHRYGKPRQAIDNTHEGLPPVILSVDPLAHGPEDNDSSPED